MLAILPSPVTSTTNEIPQDASFCCLLLLSRQAHLPHHGDQTPSHDDPPQSDRLVSQYYVGNSIDNRYETHRTFSTAVHTTYRTLEQVFKNDLILLSDTLQSEGIETPGNRVLKISFDPFYTAHSMYRFTP